MDNGFPLTTEINVLKELVHPPSGIKKAMKAIGVGNKSKYVIVVCFFSRAAFCVGWSWRCCVRRARTSHGLHLRYVFTCEPDGCFCRAASVASPQNFVLFLPPYSVSQSLPSGQLSNIPWRKSEVWYPANDIYVDLIEEVRCAPAVRPFNPAKFFGSMPYIRPLAPSTVVRSTATCL